MKEGYKYRRYKEKLRDWGVEKYIPKDVLQFTAEKHEQRLQDGTETVTFYKGVQLDDETIKKHRTRQQYPSQAAATSPPKGIILENFLGKVVTLTLSLCSNSARC